MSHLRVGLYARVSSEQQVVEGTIDSQLAILQERIAEDGHALSQELSFIDEGYSGSTLIRPALERLRDAVAIQELDCLYVLDPDRLARRYAYQVLLMDEFRNHGIQVIFLNHQIGQSAEDQLLLQVQGIIAEYERAKILERSRRGKRQAAQSGKIAVLSGAPYGYRYVSKQDGGGQARYEVILDQARVVRQIFQWIALERVSIGEVCRRLTTAGERTRTGKTNWDRSVIWGMLKNPAYKGTAAFGKTRSTAMQARLRPQRGAAAQPRRPISTEDVPSQDWLLIPVPALVSEELFDLVQQQLEENRHRARQHKHGASYLLQGLLVCEQCAYAYYGKKVSKKSAKGKTVYAYYRCIGTDAYRFGGERVCDNLQVRTDLLDRLVWQEVYDLLTQQQRLEQEYQRRLQSSDTEHEDLSLLQIQISKLQQGMARLIDGYAGGFIRKQEFEPRIMRLRQRLADLETKAQLVADQVAQQTELRTIISRLEDFASQVKNRLEEADWHMQRNLIRALVKRVEIGKEQVNVIFRIGADPFEISLQRESLQRRWRRDVPRLSKTACTYDDDMKLSSLIRSR